MARKACGTQPDKETGRPSGSLDTTGGTDRRGPRRRRGSGAAWRTTTSGGNKTFEARCEAREPGYALVAVAGLSVFIAQRIRKDRLERMWDSVMIRCAEEPDGTLAVRVFISNPDWEELLQIACIRSKPSDAESLTPLGCNLDHIAESQA